MKAYLDQLPDTIKNDSAKMEYLDKFNNYGEVVNNLFEANKKTNDLSSTVESYKGKVFVPGENASPEDLKAYYKAIDAPEKPEDVGLTASEKDDKELLDFFQKTVVEEKLTKKQAKSFYEKYNQFISSRQIDPAAEEKKVEDALRSEWGSKYDEAKANISATFNTFVGVDEASEIIKKYGNDVVINKVFAKIGEKLRGLKVLGDGSGTSKPENKGQFHYKSLE